MSPYNSPTPSVVRRWRAPNRVASYPGLALIAGCAGLLDLMPGPAAHGGGPYTPPGGSSGIIFNDVSATHLPLGAVDSRSMDAEPWDLDGDGDLDLVIAVEFQPNVVLINDGQGRFTDESQARIPRTFHDSEDIAIADFDGDGDPDILIVSEDDAVNELYLNQGGGFFTDASGRIPVTGISNAVVAADITGDGAVDIFIGNRGQNVVLINDGNGFFSDETGARLPTDTRITQDLELGDVDGDGDLDLLFGNENGNRLLLNDGSGFFTDETLGRLPLPPEGQETREADLGDIDGDGDLDIFFANVQFFQQSPRKNRLLLNDGDGFFTDVTEERLPDDRRGTVDVDFVDIDDDGHLDLLLANAGGGDSQILLNDGTGRFQDATGALLRTRVVSLGFDVEAADFNGDALLDIYLADFDGADELLLAEDRGIFWRIKPVP